MTYPNRVPIEERPEFTQENIPENVIEHAIGIAVAYGGCPDCGQEQFYNIVPGHNSSHICKNCEEEFRVVG